MGWHGRQVAVVETGRCRLAWSGRDLPGAAR
jgi:hypothetical protein